MREVKSGNCLILRFLVTKEPSGNLPPQSPLSHESSHYRAGSTDYVGSAGWLLLLCGSLTLHGALRPYFRTKAAEWALPALQPMLACLRGSRLNLTFR